MKKSSLVFISIILLVFNACSSAPSICGKKNSHEVKKSILEKIYDFNKIIAPTYINPLAVAIGNIENRTKKKAPIKDITSSLKYILNLTDSISKNSNENYTLDIDVINLDTVDSLESITLRFGLKDKSGKNIKSIIKKIIYKTKSNNEVSFTIPNNSLNNLEARDIRSSLKILIALGVTELLGRVNKLPYWIVTKQKADKTILNNLNKQFLEDSVSQKVLKISSLLHFKYNDIEPTKFMNHSLESTIIKYKKSHNMSADTTLSRQLYMSLLKEKTDDKTKNN